MLQVWPGLRAPIKKLTQADDRRGNLYQVWVGKPPHVRTYAAPAVCLPLQRLLSCLLRGWRTCCGLGLLCGGGVDVLLG
jgi:hypothetical protein